TLAGLRRTRVARFENSDEELMRRSIKTLHNFKPPATDEEIRAASLQSVRKLAGFTRPSKVNEPAFNLAVDQVNQAVHQLLASLVTSASPRNRSSRRDRLSAGV